MVTLSVLVVFKNARVLIQRRPRNVLDNNGDLVLDEGGKQVVYNGGLKPSYSSVFETFIKNGSISNNWGVIDDMERALKMYGIFNSMLRIWVVNPENNVSRLLDYKSGTSLTASGDVNQTVEGISGNGSNSYFDTGQNFSTRISDIDNFSMGIVSQTDDNSGIDFGATDGTNEVSISIRDSDQVTFNCGTVMVQEANSDGTGHYILHCYDGDLYGWKGYHDAELTQVDSETIIMGSLPNYNAFIGARNDTGTDDNHSAKYYSTIWMYNGALTETQLDILHRIIMINDYNFGRTVDGS